MDKANLGNLKMGILSYNHPKYSDWTWLKWTNWTDLTTRSDIQNISILIMCKTFLIRSFHILAAAVPAPARCSWASCFLRSWWSWWSAWLSTSRSSITRIRTRMRCRSRSPNWRPLWSAAYATTSTRSTDLRTWIYTIGHINNNSVEIEIETN